MENFDPARLERLQAAMTGAVERGDVGGLAWLVERGGEVDTGVAGTLTRGEPAPVQRDTIFRIASMTKPITAVAALLLVEECRLRVEDAVDDHLPELAGRRVLVDPAGAIDGPTVAAHRPITVGDVLTFRLGWGMDFQRPWPQPLQTAMDELGLGAGPPAPSGPPDPVEWVRRLGTLPLLHQPGERWLYNTGSEVLGVLVARASGQPFDTFLRERVLEPLGMADTGFWTSGTDRLVTAYGTDPTNGERSVYDRPDGQWTAPPAFPSGAAGLVSTLDDLRAFARMLLAGGAPLLSRATVQAMTTDQLLPGQGGPGFDGAQGWGYGVGVARRRNGTDRGPGAYGWDGGLGTSWSNDPAEGLIGIVLTNEAFATAYPAPAVIRDFWTATYAALA
jgi:CubicO group peptidase (beta-lactamase class C family)